MASGSAIDRFDAKPFIIFGGFALPAFISFALLIAENSGMSNPGLYLTGYAIANIIGQFTSGPISDRMGPPWIIVPSVEVGAFGVERFE